MPFRSAGMSDLLREAYETARRAHEGRTRKGSDIPEFSHPLAVAGIIQEHAFDDEVIAAGLLHDVVEDTSLAWSDLEGRFPQRVLGIVRELTEPELERPRMETWEIRKAAKLASLRRAGEDTLAVCAADRLHNTRCLIASARSHGLAAWDSFNRGPENTLWFERRVQEILEERFSHPLSNEYRAAVGELAEVVENLDRQGEQG